MEELEAKLIQDNWVNAQQLSLAKQEAKRLGKSIWAGLLKLGYLSEEDITIFLAQESGITYVRVSDYELSDEIIRLVDENFCRQNQVIPLFKIKNTLFVACTNPLDTALVDSLAKLTNCDIEPLLSSSHLITQAQDYYYGIEDRTFALEKFVVRPTPLRGFMFGRESERLPLNIPVLLKVEDKGLVLHYSSAIEAHTRNISSTGTAIGLYIFLFLPKGTNLSLEFKLAGGLSSEPSQIIKAKGEVVYCLMEKDQHYFLGIKFTEIEDTARSQLLKLAAAVKGVNFK
jgi:hypothetical protein